jgi:hypothetical protein
MVAPNKSSLRQMVSFEAGPDVETPCTQRRPPFTSLLENSYFIACEDVEQTPEMVCVMGILLFVAIQFVQLGCQLVTRSSDVGLPSLELVVEVGL